MSPLVRLFLNKNDQSSLNKFISQAQWAEDELNYRRVQFERSVYASK
jgi:hypothetical protein